MDLTPDEQRLIEQRRVELAVALPLTEAEQKLVIAFRETYRLTRANLAHRHLMELRNEVNSIYPAGTVIRDDAFTVVRAVSAMIDVRLTKIENAARLKSPEPR